MKSYVLRENVLTDNTLLLADSGKVFKGGYIAIIKEYEYANSWNDRELPNKRFRTEKRLNEYLSKNYPNFVY